MLVLTRKKGETIHIGNDITLQVLEIRGHRGIEAPREIPIHRSEILNIEFDSSEAGNMFKKELQTT